MNTQPIIHEEFAQNSILVTYKGKLLLISREVLSGDNIWGFICEEKTRTEFLEDRVRKELKFVTRLSMITIDKIKLPAGGKYVHIFHVKLTDKDVNSMVRMNGYRLEFYRLEEIKKLKLSPSASYILSTFHDEVLSVLSE